jgi:hypothetical protein
MLFDVQVCWPGAHVPAHEAVAPFWTHVWLVHVTGAPHVPVASHVDTPLLAPPSAPAAHCVEPALQEPVHMPPMQVWFTHAAPFACQLPVASHICGCWPLHWIAPGLHATQAPARQAGVVPVHAEPTFCQAVPEELHCCGRAPAQLSTFGSHGMHLPLHADSVPSGKQETCPVVQ